MLSRFGQTMFNSGQPNKTVTFKELVYPPINSLPSGFIYSDDLNTFYSMKNLSKKER